MPLKNALYLTHERRHMSMPLKNALYLTHEGVCPKLIKMPSFPHQLQGIPFLCPGFKCPI